VALDHPEPPKKDGQRHIVRRLGRDAGDRPEAPGGLTGAVLAPPPECVAEWLIALALGFILIKSVHTT